MAIRILLNGAKGRMGQAIQTAAKNGDYDFVALTDQGDNPEQAMGDADVIVDFSHHSVTERLAGLAAQHGLPIVIGTTGHSEADRESILKFSEKIPMVWSGNYSIGMNLLFYFAKTAAASLPTTFEPEIVEAHHHHKKDAPSGTAWDIARRICEARGWDVETHVTTSRSGITGERPEAQLGIHAIRGGDVVGDHSVNFFGIGERFELRHQATDRNVFAQGALQSAKWAVAQKPGFYEMQDVLGLR